MYLGIDLGTGSVKLMLLDRDGIEYVTSESYPIETPKMGYAETNPAAWLKAIRNAVERLPSLSNLRGIGFSGQMHGVVPLDADNETPLEKAILWADQRGKSFLAPLCGLPEEVRERLVNAPASGMSATTLLWLKHENPEVYTRIRNVLFPKDYLRFVMTGEKATDYSDASGSLLYDFKDRSWYHDAIKALGLNESFLPKICSGSDFAGRVSPHGSAVFGLPIGIPVAVGGGDVPAGMFGSNIMKENEIQISIGTAAQISRPIASDRLPVLNPSLNVFEGVTEKSRFSVAAMLNAGLALEWVRRLLKFEWNEIYFALQNRNMTLKPDLLFLPYLNGARTPYMDPNARGAWIGLSLHHSKLDLVFAALLGVACTIRLGLETLGTNGVGTIRAVGGSFHHHYWSRLLATIIGRRLEISEQKDISARGAARIAAIMLDEPLGTETEKIKSYEPEQVVWIPEYFQWFKDSYQRLN